MPCIIIMTKMETQIKTHRKFMHTWWWLKIYANLLFHSWIQRCRFFLRASFEDKRAQIGVRYAMTKMTNIRCRFLCSLLLFTKNLRRTAHVVLGIPCDFWLMQCFWHLRYKIKSLTDAGENTHTHKYRLWEEYIVDWSMKFWIQLKRKLE